MRFMMMMHAPKSDGDWQIGNWSPEDFQAHMAFMMGINKQLMASGEWVDGQGLAGPGEAKLIRAGSNGAPVTDGVFPEAKEFLAGFWIVDVENVERIERLAAEISAAPGMGGRPLNMGIEVRQVMSPPPGRDA